MKATMSQDGEMRFTLNVKVRVGRLDLMNALCWRVVRTYWDDALCNAENKSLAIESCLRGLKSRKAVFSAVQDAVTSDGNNYWTWSDDVTDETAAKLNEQVRVIVERLFPELLEKQ